MKYLSTVVALFFMISACTENETAGEAAEQEVQEDQQEAFFTNLTALCGQTFKGKATFPDDPDHELVGPDLVATIAVCEDNEIRIPFHAGEDESRIWIITRTEQGMLLKHDHRYPDGTPHALTNYGGWANDEGTSTRQFFEADEETAELIPDAVTNVWMMELDLENNRFIYYLERHQAPRFRAELVGLE